MGVIEEAPRTKLQPPKNTQTPKTQYSVEHAKCSLSQGLLSKQRNRAHNS